MLFEITRLRLRGVRRAQPLGARIDPRAQRPHPDGPRIGTWRAGIFGGSRRGRVGRATGARLPPAAQEGLRALPVQRVQERQGRGPCATVGLDEGRAVVGDGLLGPGRADAGGQLAQHRAGARLARIPMTQQPEVARRRMAPRHQQGALQLPAQARQGLLELPRREVGRRQVLEKTQAQRVGSTQERLAANQRRAHRLDARLFDPPELADGLRPVGRRVPGHATQRAVLRRRREVSRRAGLRGRIGRGGRRRRGQLLGVGRRAGEKGRQGEQQQSRNEQARAHGIEEALFSKGNRGSESAPGRTVHDMKREVSLRASGLFHSPWGGFRNSEPPWSK
jgi:hypothetical protein